MPFRPSCCGCDPCCGGSKCGCNDKHKKHKENSSYLKFSGVVPVLLASQTTYLGDAGPVILSDSTVAVVSYPVARRGKLKDLAVNISPPVLVPATGLVTVQLFKNGVAVPDFVVTWVPGETTGLKSVKTDSLKLSRDDFFDLRLTLLNMQTAIDAIVITATIGVLD